MAPQEANKPTITDKEAIQAMRQGGAGDGTRIAFGSPIPSSEKVIWQGRPSFALYILGMAWSSAWLLFWVHASSHWMQWVPEAVRRDRDFTRGVLGNSRVMGYIRVAFVVLAAACVWGILKRLLKYFNEYYFFTSQRVKIRRGIVNRNFHQIELFRLKDFSVGQSLWGALFNYGNIRMKSSERLNPDIVLRGIPNGPDLIDIVRDAAQVNRAESGILNIQE